jgi:hypothetical protein
LKEFFILPILSPLKSGDEGKLLRLDTYPLCSLNDDVDSLMLARFLDFIDNGGELENAGGGGAKFGKLSLKPGGSTLLPFFLFFVSTSRSSSLNGTLRLDKRRLLLRFGVIVVL